MNLVFASGFFEPQKLLGIEYFRGLPEVYRDALFPKVPVDAHISERAPLLAQQIQQRFPKGDIHVIAHSMGGLDTRYLLAKKLLGLDQRIKSLSTISTPHRGSPVADLLLGLIPGIDSAPFQKFLNHFPAVGSGALDDLSTKAAVPFNQEIKDGPGVTHRSYFGFGDTSLALLPTVKFIESRGRTEEEKTNDGVVSLASAKWPVDLVEQPWTADHLAQIGHNLDSLDLISRFDHKTAIARVVRRATQPAAAAAPQG
jgi:triacylglycerol lipase